MEYNKIQYKRDKEQDIINASKHFFFLHSRQNPMTLLAC
jgi:hypothetical protein